MNVNMLSQTTKALNGKGFRSVVQRPGASRASRVTLRTRQRRARAVVVFSSDSEGKDSVSEIKSEIERLQKEREKNRDTLKVESKNVKGLTLSPRSKSETDSSESKKEKKGLFSGFNFSSSSGSKEDKKPLFGGGVKINAPGIAKDNIDAFTEWRAAFKKLKDFGLKSVSAKDASDLVKGNKAIILDVRTGAFYDKEHAKGSANVPYFEKVKGSSGKRLFLGSNTTEKNADFVKDVEDTLGLGFGKTIIVCCSTGGTLKNTITKRDGSSLVDSQRAFGLESLSLRAADELIEAGFKNILHLEGGFPAWTSEYLPTEGSSIKEVRAAGKEEGREADPDAWANVHKALTDFGLKSISAKEASALASSKEAVIMDVRAGAVYEKEHSNPSVSVPYFDRVKGSRGKAGKRIFLGPNTTQKNMNFVKDAQASLASGSEGKTIIVCCSTGGTIENKIKKRDGSSVVDSQRPFGSESLSLRAADELIKAGFKNVLHLEGGFPAWISEGLPTDGFNTKELKVKKPEEKKVDPYAWPNVHASLVAAGIDSLDAADASKLVDSGEAVIVDVGTVKKYEDEHVLGSINVPFLRKIETKGLKVAGGVSSLGSSDDALERNPDFLEAFKKSVGDKKVIVTCLRGGTLRTEVVSKRGKVFKDPQLKYGRDSESLRAISELLGAGYKNISHLDGGNSYWKLDKLPMSGGFLNKIQGEDAVGWRVAVYFDEQDKYYKGQITSYDAASGMYMVKYDYLGEDGQEVEVSLDQNRTKWLNKVTSEGKLKPLENGRYPTGRNIRIRKEEEKKLFLPYI